MFSLGLVPVTVCSPSLQSYHASDTFNILGSPVWLRLCFQKWISYRLWVFMEGLLWHALPAPSDCGQLLHSSLPRVSFMTVKTEPCGQSGHTWVSSQTAIHLIYTEKFLPLLFRSKNFLRHFSPQVWGIAGYELALRALLFPFSTINSLFSFSLSEQSSNPILNSLVFFFSSDCIFWFLFSFWPHNVSFA